MTTQLIPALLVEGAINDVKALLIAGFNNNLERVFEHWKQSDGAGTVNIPRIPNDKWYIVEGITPLQPPAGFIVASRSEHDLKAQNGVKQKHAILVSVLGYETETARLTRMVYRYATALWMTLHDANLHDIHVLVNSIDYSPIYTQRTGADTRQFSKDVTLACDVWQYERF